MYTLPLDYHIDDIDILRGEGVIVPLRGANAKGARVTVGQLSAHDWFFVFLPAMQYMNRAFDNAFHLVKLMESNSSEVLYDNGVALTKTLSHNHKAAYYVADLLKKVGVSKWRSGKFLRMITVDQLAELFILVYLFNTDGVKKKYLWLLNLCRGSSSESQTSSSTSTAQDGLQKLRIVPKIA